MDLKQELSALLAPVVKAAQSEYSLLAFADTIDLGGVENIDQLKESISTFIDDFGLILQESDPLNKIEQFFELLERSDELLGEILILTNGVSDINVNDALNRVIDFLIYNYLRQECPVFFSALNTIGVWGFYKNDNGTLIIHNDYNKIRESLSDYNGWLLNEYGWGGKFKFTHFWDRLFGLNQAFGLAISNKQVLEDNDALFPEEERWFYSIPFFQSVLKSYDHENLIPHFKNELGLKILPSGDFNIPGLSGFKIEPYARGEIDKEIILSEIASLSYDISGDLSGGFALEVTPNNGLEIIKSTSVKASMAINLLTKKDESKILEIIPGILNIAQNQTSLIVDTESGINLSSVFSVIDLIISFEKIALLKHLFGPGASFQVPELSLIWSEKKGLIIKGGTGDSGFDYLVNTDIKLGPLLIERVALSVSFDDEFRLEVAPTLSINLGPLGVTAEGAGLYTRLAEDNNGNFGNYSIGFGVQPPTGIGLSLNTPTMKGGGFIKFDNPDYYGAISLEIIKVGTVSAIGLISTELPIEEKNSPDKKVGYSMLIQIFGEFSPIQIGFGFTLNGVGGLLGVHRTINTDALKTTFRSGQLGQLLFPEDPISDAAAIIENLKNIFPVEKDSYVFGFMGKFAWGTPALVDFSVGIMVKLGGPAKIIILGTGITMLPNKAAPLIVLKVDMLGIIDVQEEYMTLEARLFESRISIFDLKGGMALYVSWGAVPDFIMSIGGFHSGYKLTTDRIDLPDRIETSLSGDGWKLSMQGFFAITTNTLQTGARADIYAKKKGYVAEAGAGFEAIIIFQPFSFEVDIFFYVRIKKNGKNKASAELDIHLRGPNPYNVQGQLAIKIFGIKFRVNFQATLGDKRLEEQVDIVYPLQIVKKAIEARKAQEYIAPPWLRHESKQKIEAATSDSGNGAIDMGGEVIIRQSAIPLGVSLDHVGNTPILNEQQHLSIKASGIPGSTLVKAKFAGAQFFNLTEDEKLSRPAFEDHDAGIKLSVSHHFGEPVMAEEGFENIYLDTDQYFKISGVIDPLLRFGNLHGELTPASYNLHANNVGFNMPPGSTVLSGGEGDDAEFVSNTDTYLSRRLTSTIELF